MPANVGNPSQLSKDQLKSILISHNVSLPPGDQRKAVYLQLYLKHVFSKDKETAEFSSDDEDIMSENDLLPVEDQEENAKDKMDVKSLNNIELKEQLQKRGVKPGPILPSTRSVYEKKLQHLIDLRIEENGHGEDDRYSDSEDEGSPVKRQLEMRGDIETINEMHNYSRTNVFTVTAPVPRRSSLPNGYSTTRHASGPYTHVPASLAAEYKQNLANLGDDFSVTRMLKQESIMERRSSLGHCGDSRREQNVKSMTLNQEKMTADKNTMTYRSPANTPKACVFMKLNRHQSEADTPDCSDPMSQSLLGMSATRRKPIKGAAGRPIQFRYDDLATKARMQDQTKTSTTENGKRLVSVPLQIALFAVVTLIAVLLYNMDSSPENPFIALSETNAGTQP
ncbi:LEM domain-containing protein 1 isoform 1-T1 [Pelodytes ibericus]